MTSLVFAKFLVTGYALLACSLISQAIRAIRRADAHRPCPCDAESGAVWDETWVDVWPTDTWPELTDAEVERRFARQVGWVE